MADYTSSNTGAAIDGAVDYVELLDNIVTVDSGNNRIGINNGSPASALDVTGSVTADGLTVDGGSVNNDGSAVAGKFNANGDEHIRLEISTDSTIGNQAGLDLISNSITSRFSTTGSGGLVTSVNGSNRMAIATNGDISFYEDTGTTPKLFWDASAESLGIGTAAPIGNFNINGGTGDTATQDVVQTFTRTSSTGNVLAAKLRFDNFDTNHADLKFQVKTTASSEESDSYYTDAMTIQGASGNVGIGVVPEATWSSGYEVLQLGEASFTHTSSGSCNIMGNAYADASSYKYIGFGYAQRYAQLDGTHRWYTESLNVTPDAVIDWQEVMRIDASGNVGIGTSSLNATYAPRLQVTSAAGDGTGGVLIQNYLPTLTLEDISGGAATSQIQQDQTDMLFKNNGAERMRIDASGTTTFTKSGGGNIRIAETASRYVEIFGYAEGTANGSTMTFHTIESGTSTSTERMRIDASGNLLVGTTDTTLYNNTSGGGAAFMTVGDGIRLDLARDGDVATFNRMSGTGTLLEMRQGGVTVGTIAVTASATAYNTSSDQRLKENIADADDAGAKIDAIQVRKYDWKADGSHQDYGMIAQELQVVAPEAVSGDPDSDEMMGVDYSKLVPMMLKEIQSLRARIAQLES